jgi:hypothetical protein
VKGHGATGTYGPDMLRLILLLSSLAAACSDGSEPEPDAYLGGSRLGPNDVSLLLPLPADPETSATLSRMSDEGGLVPRTLFDRLVADDILDPYESFHVVAVRFDLCDRTAPGACPTDSDGRLRVVFQPLAKASPQTIGIDVAFHAFYPIPARELGDVVASLRELRAMTGTSPDAPLAVNSAVDDAAYATKLRALVTRYAKPASLFRLTLFGQPSIISSIRWVLRGVVRDGSSYVDISIPAIDVTEQQAVLTGALDEISFEILPNADVPTGFAIAPLESTFASASRPQQLAALEALAAVDNPLLETAETLPCVSCHVSTLLLPDRAATVGVEVASLQNTFESTFNLSIDAGISTQRDRSLRNFGWFFGEPAISQRVANETAQVLAEIEARWPSTP